MPAGATVEVTTPEGNLQIKAINNFQECWDSNLKQYVEKRKPGNEAKFSAAVKFFGTIEEHLDCSSVCHIPIFGISRKLEAGPPTADCMTTLTNTWIHYLVQVLFVF